ncbi:hypothetical protein CMU92_08015 [Elizabethkingia anophelis]|nr:hypothetical protein [Elizabethkingia anophelis]MDV3601940.1 hypothetical protein [Elizabethkingia anophelis]MDV3645569.1 hypothetical protein [Elizabethkingia anophelis]MDV3726411.1 hypothetical protein [Elizabethkingia anophelis]MDV3730428.1 hypothetical protein [Elizabethkingia anophelis]
MKEKLLYVILVLFGVFCYSQNNIKPAIGYLHVKDILSARTQKKVDELSKCPESKDKNIEVLCCGIPIEARFKEGGVYLFRLLLSQYLRFPDNTNFGENTFTFTIKKNGKIGSIEMVKETDKRVGKVIKDVLRKDIFQNWSPASYYRMKVISKVTMSIYIDTDYSKYNIR